MQNQPQSDSDREKGRFDFTYFRPVGRIALIFFVGLSFYLFASTVTLLLLTKPDREVKVPDVVGKQFVDVCNGLVRKGLKPEVRFYDVYDITSGIVLTQYPEGGEIVYEGGALKLLVSRSVLYVDVPNLTGIELPFAVNKLKSLHSHNRSVSLATGAITYIPSDKTAENIVLDQSPKAGDRVTPDRRVNILVSAGKIEGDMLMPGVAGQSIDLCLDLLLSKGLSVEKEVVDTGLPERSGLVESQKPEKGAAVKRGDAVKLRVSYYKPVEQMYRAYERVQYEVSKGDDPGLYEAYVEDDSPRRIAYSRMMQPGQKMDFVFHRNGNARVAIVYNKKNIKTLRFNAEEF
ncbi:MAG TPA: PASTA domain-containing protein [Spirochaetota bacterium]|nr:PASTA domain-containing protein [Spirochaetota bacterium]